MENESVIFRELPTGTTLANGKYVIETVLGIGGFGITYKARHATLNQHFAVKEFFINGYCMRNTRHLTVHLHGMQEDMYSKYRQKFIEEAQTLAKLDHPNIVKVLDIFDENETAYIIMPFVHGKTLQSIVEQNGALSYEMGVNYMTQVCEALDYIHQQDILHRDIKPDNIMITPDNRAILIDFGSAREFLHDKLQSHTTILTPGYAPPEQYSTISRKGAYSDIYAVGAVFYFLVTGKKPLDPASRLLQDIEAPKTLMPNLPETANKIILKAMDIKPENRYQNVDELMYELTGYKNWKSIANVEVVVKKGISKKWIFGFIIILTLLLAGAGVWYYQNEKMIEEHNRIEKINNLLNGQVIELKICIIDEKSIYLCPTKGEFDTKLWYKVDENLQIKSVSTLPEGVPVCNYLYSGQMKDGFPHGEGTAIYNNKAVYTGTFKKGFRHATNGKYIEPDGTIFEGNYMDDVRNGRGKLVKTDGTVFEGVWKDGKINGPGRILDATGKEIESGIYQD